MQEALEEFKKVLHELNKQIGIEFNKLKLVKWLEKNIKRVDVNDRKGN